MANRIKEFFRLWLKAYRAPFLTASIAPVVLGTAIAWSETNQFDLIIGLLALVGTIFGHFGANILNDYYDHMSGNDDNNQNYTPFSGGSRVIQNGLMTPGQAFTGGIAAFFLTIIIGLVLVVYSGKTALVLFGLLGIGLGFAYTALPVKLAYRGLGEAAVFLAFGPVTVTGAFFAQTGCVAPLIVLVSVPVGLLVALILFVNELPDENADRLASKNTLVVKIANFADSRRLYRLILYLVAAWIICFTIFGYFSYWTLSLIVLLPKYLHLIRLSKKPFSEKREMVQLSAETIRFQFIITMFWAAIFVIAGHFS